MFSKLFLLAALSATALAAVPPLVPPSEFTCGTQNTPEIESMGRQMLAEERVGSFTFKNSKRANLLVNTYVHIVSASSSVADGNVPNSMIDSQMQTLNDRFAPHGISFSLLGIDRTINATWADNGDEERMRRALRKGNYRDFNLYILRDLGGTTTGYCYYPTSSRSYYWRDGCSVESATLPGSSGNGVTAVHEAGHWFGLRHTFEGNSCSGPGDSVDDTPQQSSSTSGCPTSRDSCPDQPGLDPINNYMDYTSSRCRTEFTPGQETRMYNMWATYRDGN